MTDPDHPPPGPAIRWWAARLWPIAALAIALGLAIGDGPASGGLAWWFGPAYLIALAIVLLTGALSSRSSFRRGYLRGQIDLVEWMQRKIEAGEHRGPFLLPTDDVEPWDPFPLDRPPPVREEA